MPDELGNTKTRRLCDKKPRAPVRKLVGLRMRIKRSPCEVLNVKKVATPRSQGRLICGTDDCYW